MSGVKNKSVGRCFACNAPMSKGYGDFSAVTADGQKVFIGEDCHGKIQMSRSAGYQSPKGGPRLWIDGERVIEAAHDR